MEQLPTVTELADLGHALATDGFGPHEQAVADLAALVRQVEPHMASLDVAGDPTAPEVARARAFSVVAERLERHRSGFEERKAQFDESFSELLAAWADHQELRHAHRPIGELWSSRASLDRLRHATAISRRQLTTTPAGCTV